MAAQHQPSLPAKRAFIVQMHADANVEQGQWQGRIEHLASYQAAHFHSLAELPTFMAEVLNVHEFARIAAAREVIDAAAHE